MPRDADRGTLPLPLETLKWTALAAFLAVFAAVQLLNWLALGSSSDLSSFFVLSAVVLASALVAHVLVFRTVEGRVRHLERQRREYADLRQAGLDISGDLDLDSLSRRISEVVRRLLDYRFAALSLDDSTGHARVFIASARGEGHLQIIEDACGDSQLLGEVLARGVRTLLADTTADTPDAKREDHPPPFNSLIVEPVPCHSPLRVVLALGDREDDLPPDSDDQAILERFASQAAVAIDNAHAHARAQELAIAEERLRISREMHDGIAQVLAYCNAKLQAVDEFLAADRAQEARESLLQLASTAREVYADVREDILGLQTLTRPEVGLHAALSRYVQLWQDQSGIIARVSIDEGFVVDPLRELQLVRIVQEALANVRKHSRARSARIEMTASKNSLRLLVEDDGNGFEPASIGSARIPRFGLTTMRERADSMRARFAVRSKLGKGTRIELELPRTAGAHILD